MDLRKNLLPWKVSEEECLPPECSADPSLGAARGGGLGDLSNRETLAGLQVRE